MAASAFMLFVALAQALEDRRYDLAILRTLGASRRQVALVLLAESLMLAAAGALLGLALAHLAALAIGRAAAGSAAGGRGAPMVARGMGGRRAGRGRGYTGRPVARVARLAPRRGGHSRGWLKRS